MTTIELQKQISEYRKRFLKLSSQINEMVISHILELEAEESDTKQYSVSYEANYPGQLIELRVIDKFTREFIEMPALWNISKIFKIDPKGNYESKIRQMEKAMEALLDMKKEAAHYIRLNNTEK